MTDTKEKVISELDLVKSDLAIVSDIVEGAKALVEECGGPNDIHDVTEYIYQRQEELQSGIELGNLYDSIIYLIEENK
jgi:hypothetical protein